MSHRRIKVRTALDTVMELYTVFDLSPIKSNEYDATARKEAVNFHWFIKNNCSAAFFEACKTLFADKPIVHKEQKPTEGQ